MPKSPQHTGLLFFGVVTFLLVLVGWWIFFLVRESYHLDEATALAKAGNTAEALRVLGAEDGGDFSAKARQFRLMFTAEGTAMGLLVLLGVFMLYRAILRESRLRTDQERFLTGATHQLKTPLATVRLGVESLLAGTMPEEKRDGYLQAMVREIDRLENDLTNLLTAGGLDASGKGLQLTPGDLSEDIREAANSMRDRFEAAGIDLQVDLPPDVCVKRNGGAVRLVLHNLLDNAVKYSAAGAAVTVRLTEASGSARVTVTDSGRGIREDELPRVFDRFFSGTVRGHKGGSGIGLFLVRELVRSHHGTVDAHSAGADTGATFTIRLPLHGERANGGPS
jgi:signal transduction histidine kinase